MKMSKKVVTTSAEHFFNIFIQFILSFVFGLSDYYPGSFCCVIMWAVLDVLRLTCFKI